MYVIMMRKRAYRDSILAIDDFQNGYYDQAMAAYDEIEWIKVIKTVYLRQQEKGITADEIAYMERARGYLQSEISVLLEMPMDEVEGYIGAVVASDLW